MRAIHRESCGGTLINLRWHALIGAPNNFTWATNSKSVGLCEVKRVTLVGKWTPIEIRPERQ